MNRFRHFITLIILASFSHFTIAQVTISGGSSVNGPYTTLSAAISALNTATISGPVTVNVNAGHVENLTSKITITVTGTMTNTITIQKSGAGANPKLIAYTGTKTPADGERDGFISLVGSDWITIDGIDLEENPLNSDPTTWMEFGIGFFRGSATNGCQNNTIRNCTITLTREHDVAGTNWHPGSNGIVLNRTNDVSSAEVIPTSVDGTHSFNKFYSNTIQNVNHGISFLGYNAPSPFTLADSGNDIGGTSAMTGNNIRNFGGRTGTIAVSDAVFVNNHKDVNVSYNIINNIAGGGVGHPNVLRGIWLNTGAASINPTVNFNNINITGGGTTHEVTCIRIEASTTFTAGNTNNVNNNTLTANYPTATSGTLYGIWSSSVPATNNMNNNTVQNFNYGAATLTGTGVMYGIHQSASNASMTLNVNNNTVNNFFRTGTTGGITIGIAITVGITGQTSNANFNTVSNLAIDGSGTSSTIYGIQISTGTVTVNNNLIENLSCLKSSGTGVIYGIYNISSPVNENYNNNTVRNLNHLGTGIVYGIYAFTTTGTRSMSNNTVHNLKTGGTTIAGLNNASSSPNVFNNKIYDIESTSTGSPVVSGIIQGSLGTSGIANIYNNLIGDLRAPNANTSAATNPSVRGINITTVTATSSVNVSFNTVYLNAASSGTNFSTTALFHTANATATTATLNMRSNILVNVSQAKGTGVTAAYQRSSTTLTNFGSVSDRNLFYAGAPCPSNLIFYDGTNALQTLSAYKSFAGVAPRDANSVTELPNFLSTNGSSALFLHIDPSIPTQIESGGLTVSGITTDFDGDTRNASTPDIGADEFSGIQAVACAGTPTAGTASAVAANICQGQSAVLNLNGYSTSGGVSIKWQSSLTNGGPYTDIACAGGQSYTTEPLAPGTYYIVAVVTCENSGQSSTSNQVTIVVNPNPTVTVTPASFNLCAGSSVTLTASGASTYTWSPAAGLNTTSGASVIASPSVNTTYTVTGSDAAGCSATATSNISTILSPVLSGVTATPAAVCTGGSSQLNVTASINTLVRDYTFSTDLTGTLDPMTGATTLVASNIDDTPSAVQSIGFTFKFDGVDYTQYSVSPDGWLLLGSTTPSSQFTNIITSTTNIPKLYPYWDDMATGTNGSVTAVVTGTAPNRILKVQWNVTIPRNTTGPANSLFQAWLYEGTNVVEFRYGVMGSAAMSASVGLTGNNPASNFNSVTITTNTASNSTANDNNTTQPEPGRLYRFTPNTIVSYSWNPAGDVNNPAIPNPTAFLAATTTTFTVTVTASNGCSSTGSVTVTVNSNPDINFTYTENSGTPNDGAICPGASVTITASGGTSYSWSDGLGSNPSITVSPTTTTIYTVSVTDANGCSNSATVAVTVNPLPLLSASLFFPSSCTANDGSINLTVSGVTPQSYSWTGPNGYTNNVEDISELFAGLYNVTVTSTQGCTNSTSYNIDLIPSCSACPVLNTLTASPGSVCANANVNLNATGLVGMGVTYGIVFKSFTSPTPTPYTGGTILGTVPNASLTSGGTAASLTTNFATAGTYYIYAILTPSPTDVSCRPFATTTLIVNALPNAATTVAETSGTTPNDGIICVGATVTITATGGTSYLWSPGGATTASIVVTPATTTTYTVTVTNASSCTAVTTRTITVNPLPTAATTVSENSGVAANDGIICAGASVTITASGGTSYLWSPGGATTAAITVSPAINTTYSVTVTNANGCTAVTTRTITVNPNPVVTTTVAETSGIAPNDGIICAGSSVTITATGGPSYLWTPGNATTAAITVTPATTTTYTVNVTNSNGCANSATRTITVNPLPVITFTSSNAAMCVGDTRQITASPVNGTFSVTGPATIVNGLLTATGVGTAVISYSVTDANGCFGSGTQSIVINASPVITTQPVDVASCEGGSVTFSVVATLSQGTLQYQWQRLDGNTWVNIAGATGATYTVNNVNASNNNQRYRVIVRNSLNTSCQVISNVAILGVHIPGAMTCNNHVNVSLDQNCGFSAFSDFFIEGPNSEMFYQVTLRAPNGQVVPQSQVRNYLNQILTVEVRDICNGNFCWGTVKFEDKTPPNIICNCPNPPALTTVFNGQLLAGGPTMNRPLTVTNTTCTLSGVGTAVLYQAFTFTATVTGLHQFSVAGLTPLTGTSGNYIGIFNAPFNPASPCASAIPPSPAFISGVTGILNNWPAAGVFLVAGQQYVIVIMGSVNPSQTNTQASNPFTITVSQPVSVIPAECYIDCFDVDKFLAENINNATRRPTITDACGSFTAVFGTEKFISEHCSNFNYVIRTWRVTDASGNVAFCEQYFPIRNITLNDIRIPNTPVDLNCKDNTDPESIASITGDIRNAYPYIVRNNVVTPVNYHLCKISCTYNDTEVTACGNHCHGNKKVIRNWVCLDWCSGQVRSINQVIKADDNEAPTAILKDTTVSTRPWDCTADFFVPNPWELHDNCDINPQWTVKGPVGVQIVPAVQVVNGQVQPHPVYKWRAVGAPKGVHTFKYTFVDCCGNERILTNEITVLDKTPPTPIAKRDIVIGLVPGFDADGFPDGQAKLFAKDVDNGSHDNCTEVRIDIRRPKGPDCGNEGLITNPATGARHNNNLTFSNRVNMPNYSPNDTDGGEFVKFCCADLEALDVDANSDGVIDELDRGFVEVIIRVWDDGNMNGIIGDAGDNWNETWAFVKVEQKVPPVITCPPDATIHCDWAIQTSTTDRPVTGIDFTKTGLPTAYGVCRNPEIRFRDVLQLNQCGIGTITRTFTVVENNVSRQCQQRITVLPSTSQQQWVVTPPSASVPEVGCDGPTEAQIKANQPTWVNGPCDVIGISTKKWEFEFEDGVCKKWVVEYKLVNWCTNEERGPYTKMFVYKDVVPPTFENCRDTMFGVDANCEIRFLTLTKRASDSGGCTENGWIKWQIFVDLWADGTDDYEWSSFLPVGNDVNNANTGNFQAIQDNNGNGIKDIYVAPTSNGGLVTIRIPEPIVGKMSNHKITWKATDGCHNHVTCHEQFMVVDKKPPTPVCVPLSSALMADPDGSGPMRPMVELWAIDFNVKSFDNCTDEEDLLFTFDNTAPQITDKVVFNRLINIDIPHYFDKTGGLLRFPADMTNAQQRAIVEKYMRGEENTAGNGVIQLWNPVQRSSAKVWTDRELAPNSNKGEVNVMMSVWDKKFNVDFCWTNLQLICNTCSNNPGGSRMIAGTILTEAGQSVSNTAVTFSVFHPEYPKTVMTSSNGQYSLMLESGMDVNIGASKNNDYLNGVSTLDLVLIQRHILGLQELDSPYKLIAADATNDGKVTAADITEIRKVILGVTTAYAANTSWRFPIAAQQMNQDNPWPFVENIVIENIQTDMTNQNFVAVKVGDVNGSAAANVSDPALESRSAKVVSFAAEDRNVAAGERVAVAISGADFADVYGYQFTMNLNGASFAEIIPGALDMTANNIGVLANNVVTMSYASRNGMTVSDDETLFTVVLRAEKDGRLSEMMSIGSAVTKAEAYTGAELQVSNVTLSMRTKEVTGDVAELFQNEPNPFRGATTVSYYLPEASDAVITVFDVTGRVVLVRKASANKGMNSEVFTKEQLGAAGVLYYRLDSGDFTATKKMIIIE